MLKLNPGKNRPPSERKMKALDIVSSRSLGSLASVQETFAKGRKQRLTGRVVFAVFVGAIAGILFGFDQNIFNMIISEPDFRESMGMPQAVVKQNLSEVLAASKKRKAAMSSPPPIPRPSLSIRPRPLADLRESQIKFNHEERVRGSRCIRPLWE